MCVCDHRETAPNSFSAVNTFVLAVQVNLTEWPRECKLTGRSKKYRIVNQTCSVALGREVKRKGVSLLLKFPLVRSLKKITRFSTDKKKKSGEIMNIFFMEELLISMLELLF